MIHGPIVKRPDPDPARCVVDGCTFQLNHYDQTGPRMFRSPRVWALQPPWRPWLSEPPARVYVCVEHLGTMLEAYGYGAELEVIS